MSKILVAYYSRADENYVSGELKYLPVGNTERAARMIAQMTGGDLFEIRQAVPYSAAYNKCIAEAQRDQREDARPPLAALPQDLGAYETVYLGYPNYWGTMPMAVFTFLGECDLSGKVIRPFCTHEGSGMGRSEADLRRLCPEAELRPGLALHGSGIDHAEETVRRWVEKEK